MASSVTSRPSSSHHHVTSPFASSGITPSYEEVLQIVRDEEEEEARERERERETEQQQQYQSTHKYQRDQQHQHQQQHRYHSHDYEQEQLAEEDRRDHEDSQPTHHQQHNHHHHHHHSISHHSHSTSPDEDVHPQLTSPSSSSPLSPSSTHSITGWLTLEHATDSGESKKRWCSLQRCFLFYAGRDKDLVHPKGVVDLKGCEINLARIDGPGGGGATLPCAFVLTHPRRAPLTFTAPSESEREMWMKALTHVIKAPTHALLSYKGRAIFDEEDAQAISSSQAAIRGFVQTQFERVASQQREESQKIAKKKIDIKALKGQKKALAKELIASTEAYNAASQESESLSAELETIQREARLYDQAQRAYFMTLVDVVNQMEECDPNRWTGPNPNVSHTFSDGFYSPRIGGTSLNTSIHSVVHENDLSTSSEMDSSAMFTSGNFSMQTPRRNASVSHFSSPQPPHHRATMSYNPTMNSPLASPPRPTSTSLTFSPHAPPRVAEPSSIEISNQQLALVQQHIQTIREQPIPTIDDLASPSTTNISSLSAPLNGLPSIASFSAESLPLLTRTDALDLQEIKQVSLDLLSSNLALRQEQNTLTQYIEAWMQRKHAARVLKASI